MNEEYCYLGNRIESYEHMETLKNGYRELIIGQLPYSHMITLTYPNYIHKKECIKIMRKFLCRFERKLFGKNQCHGRLNGFIFEEKQINEQVHNHILINDDRNFYKEGKKSIDEHYMSLINNLRHRTLNNKIVKFNIEHCDFRKVHDIDNLTDYLLKSCMKVKNFDFIDRI